ncbi:uncharacterized protein PG998_012402 [Apiospora kogelbergensis]|uniref:Uncharacterized protein n=1 Tax=Apiospora kogelbergensis TaxID=1337665 RepID=A0AAW0QUK8_9PEZI
MGDIEKDPPPPRREIACISTTPMSGPNPAVEPLQALLPEPDSPGQDPRLGERSVPVQACIVLESPSPRSAARKCRQEEGSDDGDTLGFEPKTAKSTWEKARRHAGQNRYAG